MPAKIKFSRPQKRFIALSLSERAKPIFHRLVKKFIKEVIRDSIESGRSPVNKGGVKPKGSSGKLRYKEYSTSYKDAMGTGKLKNKKKRPVNLTVTGKMLNSLKAKVGKDAVTVWFSSPIAKYHNDLGASKKKVIRRMLPMGDEEFNAGIRKRLLKALENAIKIVKKQ